jgi:hypothetical protein
MPATGNHSAGKKIGPWPDVATARSFLGGLAQKQSEVSSQPFPAACQQLADVVEVTALATWLVDQGLGPLASACCRTYWPELADHLREDVISAVAESSLHYDSLVQIGEAFQRAKVPAVLLKGAALAEGAYGYRAWRTMSDVDIWVQEHHMAQAIKLMREIGFTAGSKSERPLQLQLLSGGEIQFRRETWARGLVELHLSPLAGWWIRRTAKIDDKQVWARKEMMVSDELHYHQLAAEDMVLQVAVHLAVNHQFGMTAVRGLMDIVLVAQARPVYWEIVAERAIQWRVATATWTVLYLAHRLIGIPGVDMATDRLRPSRFRRRMLRQFVTPESVLTGVDLRSGRTRYLLLILLVDRFRDVVRLVIRALWPEPDWLAARYQGTAGRWQHIWGAIRHGRV